MSETTIVPPVPVVNQGATPEETKAAVDNLQGIFDRVMPEVKSEPTRKEAKPPIEKKEPVKEVVQPLKEEPKEALKEEPKISDTLPSSIEKLLETKSQERTQEEDVFPEQLPEFKTPEERTDRYKKWRGEYQKLKDEVKQLKEKPAVDPLVNDRVKILEDDNKKMAEMLSRTSVEHHAEFQEKVIKPLHAAYNEAAQIVKDGGGNPADLVKALSLTGKAQFEALDEIFSDMPESAKLEANQAIRNFRKLDEIRKRALADAPRTAEQLRKIDLERQVEFSKKQRSQMETFLTDAVNRLRDEGKVELLIKSNDPEAKTWNEQADKIVQESMDFFLNNTDMRKVAMAMVLSRMVDPYRVMWLKERQARMKSDGVLKEKFGSEPSLGESGGNHRVDTKPIKERLQRPFVQEFLDEVRKQREK